MQPKLPLDRTEYFECIRFALDLGKSLDAARKEWKEVNSLMGTDYHALHSKWNCCNYFE